MSGVTPAALPTLPHDGDLSISDVEKDAVKTASNDAGSDKEGIRDVTFVDEVRESVFAAFTWAQQRTVLKKVCFLHVDSSSLLFLTIL
jgi:hypothetical protein